MNATSEPAAQCYNGAKCPSIGRLRMLSDLAIAQQATLKHIHEIADQMGLSSDDLDLYGSPYVAKFRMDVLEKVKNRPNARYIDVTAITPTPLGEGKSTTTVGLG